MFQGQAEIWTLTVLTDMQSSGIYRIAVHRGDKPPRYYIGQSVVMVMRFKAHLSLLKSGKHRNPSFQRAFVRYGEAALSFEVLQHCEDDKETLLKNEQSALDSHILEFGVKRIYNCHKQCISSPLGVRRSDETKARMSAALKGQKRSPEQCERNRQSHLGKKLSPESIAKRSAKQTGRITSAETRAKQSASRIGKTMSRESRAKLSASKKGQSPSTSHMDRLRVIATGRPMDVGTRAALLASHLGTKKSAEELARRQATRTANRISKVLAAGSP